jgi:hypothetical protein
LACLQLLVDAEADLSVKNKDGDGTLFSAMLIPNKEPSHRVPGMPFAVLSCKVDSKNVNISDEVSQAMVDRHLKEYTLIHNFIDEYHNVTNHALSEDVVVDTRVGRGDNGVYHEPLEQVFLYLGLSMKKNQIVNESIDGKSGVTRALMPGHPVNANLWYELYQRTHCSSCRTRQAKLKKCTCFTTRYCNSDCQRKHWQTHKPIHNAILKKKKKK